MERLTERHYKKSDGYYIQCSEHCNSDICDCSCEKFEQIVDRLGAYEDTGLEPEELLPATALSKVACALHELNAYKALGSVDRIRELAQARQVQTNADRIRAMSDEELRSLLCDNAKCDYCKWANCDGCRLREWLQQPAEEDD